MPSTSKKQQRLFGMALAYERGKMKGKASKKVKELSKKMSETELEKYASTKHKGLKEHRALSFLNFINEAYLDAEGNLRDFEFTDDEQLEINSYEDIQQIKELFSELGAKNVEHYVRHGRLAILFNFFDSRFMMVLDLDTETAELSKVNRMESEIDLIYKGDADGLINLITTKGLDFLYGI